eukprot:scaffold15305_cov126-Cylindrotheca_fusiformis.AAC.5
MGKRKALTPVDSNSLSRLQILESKDESTRRQLIQGKLCTSSKTPRMSNTSILSKGRPPLSRLKNRLDFRAIIRHQKGTKNQVKRSDDAARESPAILSGESSDENQTSQGFDWRKTARQHLVDQGNKICLEEFKTKDIHPMDAELAPTLGLSQRHLRDEDMEGRPDSPTFDSNSSSSSSPSYWHRCILARSGGNYKPVKSQDRIGDANVQLPILGSVGQRHSLGHQDPRADDERPLTRVSTASHFGTVGGIMLSQSEVTIPILGESQAEDRECRREQPKNMFVSKAYHSDESAMSQEEYTPTTPCAKDFSGQPCEDGDDDVAVWSIDDEVASGPIMFQVDNKSYLHPPLPPGWEIIVSESRRRPFYVHPDFGTTWHCPVVLPHKTNSTSSSANNDRRLGREKAKQKLARHLPALATSGIALSKSNDEQVVDTVFSEESPPSCMSDLVNRYHNDINLQRSFGSGSVSIPLKSDRIPPLVGKMASSCALAESRANRIASPNKASPRNEDIDSQVQGNCKNRSFSIDIDSPSVGSLPLLQNKGTSRVNTDSKDQGYGVGDCHCATSKNGTRREVAKKVVDAVDNVQLDTNQGRLCDATSPMHQRTEHEMKSTIDAQVSEAKSVPKTSRFESLLVSQGILGHTPRTPTQIENSGDEGHVVHKMNKADPNASSKCHHDGTSKITAAMAAPCEPMLTANMSRRKSGWDMMTGNTPSISLGRKYPMVVVGHVLGSGDTLLKTGLRCMAKSNTTASSEGISEILLASAHQSKSPISATAKTDEISNETNASNAETTPEYFASCDDSSIASPLRSDCSHARQEAPTSINQRKKGGARKRNAKRCNPVSTATYTEGSSLPSMMLNSDADLFCSSPNRYRRSEQGADNSMGRKYVLKEGKMENVESEASIRSIYKSDKPCGDMYAKHSIQATSSTSSTVTDDDHGRLSKMSSVSTDASEKANPTELDGRVEFSVRHRASNDGSRYSSDDSSTTEIATSELGHTYFRTCSIADLRTRNGATIMVPSLDQTKPPFTSTFASKNVPLCPSVDSQEDSSDGTTAWDEANFTYDTESESCIGEHKEMTVKSSRSERSIKHVVSSKLVAQESSSPPRFIDSSKFSLRPGPRCKRMSWRVLEPQMPLCSLQQLDILCYAEERRMARQRGREIRNKSSKTKHLSRISRMRKK